MFGRIVPRRVNRAANASITGVLCALALTPISADEPAAPALQIAIEPSESSVPERQRNGRSEPGPEVLNCASIHVSVTVPAAIPLSDDSFVVKIQLRSSTTGRLHHESERAAVRTDATSDVTVHFAEIPLPREDDALQIDASVVPRRWLMAWSAPKPLATASTSFYRLVPTPRFGKPLEWIEVARLLESSRSWWSPETLGVSLLPDSLRRSESRLLSPQKFLPGEVEQWINGALLVDGASPLRRQVVEGEAMLVLDPGRWQLLPLPSLRQSGPHRVAVELVRGQEAQLSISVAPPPTDSPPSAMLHGSTVVIEEDALSEDSNPESDRSEHRLTFWPRPGVSNVLLFNPGDTPVRLRSVRLQRAEFGETSEQIADTAPAIDAGGTRQIAFFAGQQLLASLGHQAGNLTEDPAGAGDPPPSAAADAFAAASYLTWQVKRSGCNAAIVQLREHDAFSRTLAMLFDREGLRLVPSIQFRGRSPQLDQQTAIPERSVGMLVRPSAEQQRRGEPRYNIMDPRIQAEFDRQTDLLLSYLRDYDCFAGLSIQVGARSHLLPADPDEASDPVTINAFANDVNRVFASTADFLEWTRRDGRPAWEKWRTAHLVRFLNRVAQHAEGKPLFIVRTHSPIGNVAGEMDGQQRSGFDLKAISTLPNMRVLIDIPHANDASFYQQQQAYHSSQQLSQLPVNSVTGWLNLTDGVESVYTNVERESATYHVSRAGYELAASELPLHKLLVGGDRSMIVIGGDQFPWGCEMQNAPRLKELASLPAVAQDVGVFSGGVSLCRLQRGGDTALLIVNPNRWPHSVSVQLKPTSDVAEVNSRESEHVAVTPKASHWAGELPGKSFRVVTLPGDVKLVRTVVQAVDIEQAAASIRSALHDVGQRVAIYGGLASGELIPGGSFEEEVEGKPKNWLVSQHPVDAVQIDPARAYEGESSVRLENRGAGNNQTWLLSQPLRLPESGRMAISLNAMFEGPVESPPLIRLSLEARYPDQQRKTSVELGGMDSGEMLAREWSRGRYVVATGQLPREGLQELKLAIDVRGPGRVWIDDVRRHDHALSPRQRADLQRQIYLAAEGLSQGDLLAASQLFENPLVAQLRGLPLPAPPSSETAEPEEKPRPSVADRIRGMLPAGLRF